ncbi:Ankyrin and HET domain protein [Penicillium coprophilum]|uniref:Ankyrin and HET domain protein n=1 Tax=Penicillium coprophilum TaxID=36646 RepID=UPI00239FED6B|nr:Ankyrin and HET domain protein [Penicillium coprophilum]KAJ5171587.1 Ankyrin and HET domain protein [Penicillium coprophilum]
MMNEPTNISRPVLFRAREGLPGKGTKNRAGKGDEVWLIAGMPTPVVLRKTEREDCFTRTDIVYVHGIMHGELFDQKDRIQEEIELI